MDADDIAKELVEIMGWDKDYVLNGVLQEIKDPGSHIRADWLQGNPRTSEEIEEFYTKTTAYIFDLMVESARDVRVRWRESVIQGIKRVRGESRSARLLDYGGGVGTDSLMFAKHCKQVTYLDLPGITSEFAGKRFAYHQEHLAQATQTAVYNAEFDAVVSFEVLEHLVDPTAHLKEMVRITKPGGMLFLTESFELVSDDYPSHLPENIRYARKLVTLMQEYGCRFLETLEGRIHVFLKGPPITVIIPIYNALEHTRKLLESIRNTHAGYPVHWLLVNDSSPDSRIAPLLDDFSKSFSQPCRVNNQKENVGFVQTCNIAMQETSPNDVILLNNDTILYNGWVRKLVEAAYNAPDIGTAMPLSNNASCYSLFRNIEVDNDLSTLLEQEDRELLEIPTGVGFCLYIKRELLQKVGIFDEAFGKGYGEETDFCRRALKAGYRHVLTPKAFVYHAGGASMVAAQVREAESISVLEHERLIKERYPDYTQAVEDFIQSGTINSLSADLSRRYVIYQSAIRPSIAMVVHHDIFGNLIGGTEFHVGDLVRGLQKDYIFYIIYPNDFGGLTVTASVDGIQLTVIWDSSNYEDLLADLRPSLIHIHHLKDFPPTFVKALRCWEGPKVYTIHDYYALCPHYTLLNDRGVYCGVPEKLECSRCARRLFQTGYETPHQQRMTHQHLINSVDIVIAPSQAALATFRKGITIPDHKVRVLPHPLPSQKLNGKIRPYSAARVSEEILVVGFIGYKDAHKGASIIQEIVVRCSADPIRFVAIGNLLLEQRNHNEKISSTGLYRREEVVEIIKHYHLDVMVIASPWPETYSYTLSETWRAGVPAIVGPLGAPAERVRATGAGLVLPNYHVDSYVSTLRNLAQDKGLLAQLKGAASIVPLRSDFGEYQTLYASLTHQIPNATWLFSAINNLDHQRNSTIPSVNMEALATISALVNLRKKLFPPGSLRERPYIMLRDRIRAVRS